MGAASAARTMAGVSAVERVRALELRSIVESFRDLLVTHREMINALNVYPVPDGDTGTNMSLTLTSVCEAFDDSADPEDLAAVCHAISHGSLMGARGNSGVIMSQILRGLANTLAESDLTPAQAWASAFAIAAEAAYGAVQRPVEGTILTVVREVGEEASAAVAANPEIELLALIEQCHVRGHDALDRTPDMLQVLKDAGVVDAGGRGLLLLLDAILHQLDGRPLPEPPTDYVRVATASAPAPSSSGASGDKNTGEKSSGKKNIADLRYEVMFLLDAPDESVASFRSRWAEIGDSIVVVGGDGLFNCHIHTDEIGESIEAAIAVGRPHQIRVTDLLEELDHMETLVDHDAEGGTDGIYVNSTEPTRCGAVAVGVGSGVRRIFESLGVKAMVLGGQSMNPSTEVLLQAVERVAADEVLLLPNNKNIIAVAEQVNAHTDKIVRVVPTRSVTEGFASLLEFDPEASADSNQETMASAAQAVVAGEVTVAVRDAGSDVGQVTTGDHIGIGPTGIRSIGDSLVAATSALLDDLLDDDHEIVTLIAGSDAAESDTQGVIAWLAANHGDVEVEVHHGGQPLYAYYIGIE